MDREHIKGLADKVYGFSIAEHPDCCDKTEGVDVNPASWGLDINDWDWNAGVGVTAFCEYYKASKEKKVLDYLIGWVSRNRHQAKKFDHVNMMAPLNIYPDMYRITGDKYYLDTAREFGEWVLANTTRTLTGAFQHGFNLEQEIWADTIFMVVLFLARLGRLTGDGKYVEEAVKQLLLHLKYLQDQETGVLFHGYQCINKNHLSAARWTRGNSWVAVGTPMILEEVKGLVPVQEELLSRYIRMMTALAGFQDKNGLWHTVMDRPDFYYETSGSAGIAAGIFKGVRLGILSEDLLSAGEKALEGITGMIKENGEVDCVSGGTPIMKTVEEYGALSCYPTLYGQGLTLILLSELI